MSFNRNDPCPCGSGKKYKKCCLNKENQGLDRTNNSIKETRQSISGHNSSVFYSDLDALSNSIVDLVKSKDYQKAKDVCKKLMQEYPDQVDGYERLASIYEAEGDVMKAVEYYRKTADFMLNHPGFDSEGINYYREKADRLENGTT
jgi:tetratricopeptide (TPR) repeat protein